MTPGWLLDALGLSVLVCKVGIGATTASSGGWEARRIWQSPVAGGVRVAVKTVGVHEEGGQEQEEGEGTA